MPSMAWTTCTSSFPATRCRATLVPNSNIRICSLIGCEEHSRGGERQYESPHPTHPARQNAILRTPCKVPFVPYQLLKEYPVVAGNLPKFCGLAKLTVLLAV